MSKSLEPGFLTKVEFSALLTVIGVILLFSGAVIVTLIAPRYIDPTWTSPSSAYQVQMYEISDPHLYIGTQNSHGQDLQFVYHIVKDFSLLAFHETESIRIIAPKELERFITKHDEEKIKLTSNLLLLRKPQGSFVENAQILQKKLRQEWEGSNKDWKEAGKIPPGYDVLELYVPSGNEAFAIAPRDGTIENWVDSNYEILDDTPKQKYHLDVGVVYIHNPQEYRISEYTFGAEKGWQYDPQGKAITDLEELKSHQLGFRSRKDLIALGEHIYAIEGCWYCHTDQTRTLIQDVVLNGSESYPAPPSSANEYIYQQITFPGTRRIGPDISRVGIKRPSRDWHKGHFWSPKTASKGSIMPPFQHFFDYDPRGTGTNIAGVPNYQFEAMFQYLMTKGTRITAPTKAWWLGKDPIRTKEIIEGERKLP